MNEEIALKKINTFLTQLTNNRRNCSKNGLTFDDQEFDWEHNYIEYLTPTSLSNKPLRTQWFDDNGNELTTPIPSYEYADGKWINYPESFALMGMESNLLSAIFEHIVWNCAFMVDESSQTIELRVSLYFSPKVGYRKLNLKEATTTVTYNYSAETDIWTQYNLYDSAQHLDVFDPFKSYVPTVSTENIDLLTSMFDKNQ